MGEKQIVNDSRNLRRLIPGILLIFGLGLIGFSFWPEAKKENSSKNKVESNVQVKPTVATTSGSTISSPVLTDVSPKPQIVNPTPTLEPSSARVVLATATPIPTSTPIPTVNLQIIEPDGTFNFSVTVHNGDTACDNLLEAKQEGKIKSVTLDNSYMSSTRSLYVREMNGFNNNWTFTVNGKSPLGCSLYTPNSGDTIVWKFE